MISIMAAPMDIPTSVSMAPTPAVSAFRMTAIHVGEVQSQSEFSSASWVKCVTFFFIYFCLFVLLHLKFETTPIY